MAETAERYERLAQFLTSEGYIVYANDHRGHGKTAKNIESLGYIGEDGFNWMVKNQHQLNSIIKDENPNLPIFLLGHSMGSFISRQYISDYGNTLNGVILSGSNGLLGVEVSLGILLSRLQIKMLGARTKSNLLNNMSFGSFNKAFKPCRTDFDWLSRDSKEVDKYIANPYCGTVFSTSFFYEFFSGLKNLQRKEVLDGIPKELPVYIMSGDKDPVGKYGKGVTHLESIFKAINIKDVTLKLYEGGRHEMLNEINRDEVMKDIVNWINLHL
jgi:alpha-beta hydrolase superfamily lysophospholipase